MNYFKTWRFISILIVPLFITCCNEPKDNSQLIEQLDSLKIELRALTQQLAKQNQTADTLSKKQQPPALKKEEKKQPETKQETKQEPKKTEPKKHPDLPHPPTDNPIPDHQKLKGTLTENDTIKYFYTNKKISVLVHPLKDGKRQYLVFDQRGNVTFEMESIRLSYSQSIDLRFHENGAVRLAKINFNPGASMYWYETEITFDENNYPLKKIERQMPPSSAADELNNRYFWNKDEKKWIKQEIIREYNTPNGPIDLKKGR
jgi:hypothetical protein